jgi:hypothetical protein
MSSPAVQLADAIADDLHEVMGDLWGDASWQVERAYRPVLDLEDLDDLRIIVVPAATEQQRIDRESHERRVAVLVSVQTRCGPEQTDKLDDLAGLVHDIGDHLTDRRFDDLHAARFDGIESDPLFHPDLLETRRVFLAPSLVRYRILN